VDCGSGAADCEGALTRMLEQAKFDYRGDQRLSRKPGNPENTGRGIRKPESQEALAQA
jgi:hypothetical protein